MMTGQRSMNCCWNILGNLRVHVVILRGQRLLPLAPFTLYLCVCTNAGLSWSLLKHSFYIQEIVAPVSNREIVLFLLTVTGKFTAYLTLLSLTSKNSFQVWWRVKVTIRTVGVIGVFDIFRIWYYVLDVLLWPIISLIWLLVLHDLHSSLFELTALLWFAPGCWLSVLLWYDLFCLYDFWNT